MKRVVISCAAILVSLAASVRAQEVGSVAPDFKLDTWINGSGEKSVSEFLGKLVLVEMWSPG